MDYNNNYKIYIFERYTDLIKSKKENFDNNDLWKIFEYYSCIKLSEEYSKQFYEYDDIDPNFKEINKMTRNDTGIDCSDLDKTIVQCKLRKNTLTWKDCSTFFGSQNIFSTELKKSIIRWDNLIITRNNDCTLSENLLERHELFIDKKYDKEDIILFCKELINNPPKYPDINNNFELRDYQKEAIEIITKNIKNVVINLPTGTGKNSIIIYSMKDKFKYLILVPRIILMDQLKKEIIQHKSNLKNKIQLIGDNNQTFDENKLITICVFNSVHLLQNYFSNFEKIFIDEAHHIHTPIIYENDDYSNDEYNSDSDSEYDDIGDEYDDSGDECDEYDDDSCNNSVNTSINNNDKINIIEDDDKELVHSNNYTKIIKNLVMYNNNIYLSATIDPIDNFEYYTKDIRTMIDLKYLCDYTIHIPIFNDDPINKNICTHLLTNYKNIIIYCNSQKEGIEINKLMNKLQLHCSEYIDCNTPKKKRNNIIEKYKNGEMPFLINVRILVEGFDAPITKGVCFIHLPTNKTTLIQIIGRALRLYSTKTIANIILPFSSKEDEKNICNFLKIISKNDNRIKKSFESKNLGGYIHVDKMEEIDDDEEMNKNIEFKYNMIYNSMCVLQNNDEIWKHKLQDVKEYINTNKKRPSCTDKNKTIQSLGYWLGTQNKNYDKDILKSKHIMKNKEINTLWNEFLQDVKYKEYFLNNDEIWKQKLQNVKDYIDTNNKTPSCHNKNKTIRSLAQWIGTQKNNYNNDICIFKCNEIHILWTHFLQDVKYKEYFLNNDEIWKQKLQDVKKYIDKHQKSPSQEDKDKTIKSLGRWLGTQKTNYDNNISKCNEIMKNKEIHISWTEFTQDNKYNKYFLNNDEMWKQKLQDVKDYIDKNQKLPPHEDKNKNIQSLRIWFRRQKKNYDNDISKSKYIMKNEEIHILWTEFIQNVKYQKY